jgi:hypothetical protein
LVCTLFTKDVFLNSFKLKPPIYFINYFYLYFLFNNSDSLVKYLFIYILTVTLISFYLEKQKAFLHLEETPRLFNSSPMGNIFIVRIKIAL